MRVQGDSRKGGPDGLGFEPAQIVREDFLRIVLTFYKKYDRIKISI